MRVEVGPGGRVRHHECTESRCGDGMDAATRGLRIYSGTQA